MVDYKDIISNNTSLKSSGSGVVAVFVGGTNGIGLATLRAFVKHTDSPTAYIVGRSIKRLEELISELKTTNESATLIPIIGGDLTLVRDAQRAADEIASKAKKIDLLIESPGYISAYRDESPEGLDRVTAIRFYSRMRFLVTLAPALRAAPNPRVVQVLASGQEGQLWPEDFRLKNHYGIINAAGASASMVTLFLEEFARQPENKKISFVHLYPGVVKGTGLQFVGLNFFFNFLLTWVAQPVFSVIGWTPEESGERVLFAATNGRFRKTTSNAEGTNVEKGSDGVVGSGVYLVQPNSSVLIENKILKKMKSEGMAKKIYDHTLEELALVEGRN